MKSSFQKIVIIIAAAAVAELFMPWWIIAVVAALVAIWDNADNAITPFANAFTAISILWLGYIMVLDITTNAILSNKIAALLQLPSKNYLISITTFIGANVAGLGGLTGHYFRKLFAKKRY